MIEDTRIVSEANVAYVAEKLNNTIFSGPENSTEGYIVSSYPQKPAKMKFVSEIFGLESNGSLDNRIVNVGLLKYIIQECGLIIPDGYETWQTYDGMSGIYAKDQIVRDPTDEQLYKSLIDYNVWGPPSEQPDFWELYEA